MTITDNRRRQPARSAAPRRRKEDARLITGRTIWTENVMLPGMLHLAILRSPMAHARITSIDVSPALAMPGVVAAFTGRDVADARARCRARGRSPRTWCTPTTRRWPSTRCATWARRSPSSPPAPGPPPLDALAAIEVDYEPLPVVLDMEAALADGADLVHADKGTNKSYTWVFDSAEAGTGGAVGAAFAERRGRHQAGATSSSG